ncbi:MAG: hypothetical protein EPN57_20545 [Paraburkholderia sp.]|nr:MAG: hypothetical protein EPN57_20545 [Paraburkholderia sp.]
MPTKKIVEQLPGRTYASIAKRRGKLNLPKRSGAGVSPMERPEMQQLWKALKKHKATRAQLAKRADVVPATVSKFVKLFRSQFHVCGWVKADPNGDYAEVLKAGPGKDAPKPAPASASERCHQWWERCKRERPLDAGRRLARDAVRRREREGKLVRRDAAAVALFGKDGLSGPANDG